MTNYRGKELIDMCISTSLLICNGRIAGDKQGSFTRDCTTGKSVVDYAIMSDSLLPLISDFEVDTFDNCLSDVHCPLGV